MSFHLDQLDDDTRALMLEEFDSDVEAERLYYGKRLNAQGVDNYPDLLRDAIAHGSPESLASALSPVPGQYWIEGILDKRGHRSPTKSNNPEMLGEGEFNRFYMRAIARRALDEGSGYVLVVRAKSVANPRADHLVKVVEGDRLEAGAVLEDLRGHPGEPTELGIPRGPMSGLSLRID